MKDKTRFRLKLGGFLTLLTIAIVGIAYGVATHTEPGLMGVCWDGDQVARVESDGANDCPEVLWNKDQIPLGVYAYTNNPNPVADPGHAVDVARDLINTQLGFTFYVMSPDMDSADVVVATGVPYDKVVFGDARGITTFERHRGKLRAQVQTTNEGTVEFLHQRIVHELGHGAGLAHDPFVDSAMFIGAEITRFTDDDRKQLRQLYKSDKIQTRWNRWNRAPNAYDGNAMYAGCERPAVARFALGSPVSFR